MGPVHECYDSIEHRDIFHDKVADCHRQGPGACIIKLITAVIYSFRNKLKCLSLASLSSLVLCLSSNTPAYYGNRKLRPY